MRSTAERLREEGLEQGREEGRLRGKASLALRLIELKFGPLDEIERARIDPADEERLDRWSERLLYATSKEGLFA